MPTPRQRPSVAVALALLVAACSPGGTTTPSASSPGTGESAAPSTAGTPAATATSPASPSPTSQVVDITPDAPNAIAVAGDRIWASTRSGVASIDPATNTAGPSHDLGGTTGSVSAIIAGNEAMWVVEYDDAVVV